MLTTKEAAEDFVSIGIHKSKISIPSMLLMGIFAGVLIGFAANVTSVAIHGIENIGVAKLIASLIFPFGLVMVIMTGSELFTGNSLMFIAALEKKISWKSMLRNWIVVYFANLTGSVLLAALIVASGQLGYSGNMLAVYAIKVAVGKVGLSFGAAFILGILCNVLVCAAVFMATQAKNVSGKIMAAYVPVCMFILGGFEHSVANMYYISVGIIASGNAHYLAAAQAAGVQTQALTWVNMFVKNLLPVTLGNVIGGAVLFAGVMWFVNIRKAKAPPIISEVEKGA